MFAEQGQVMQQQVAEIAGIELQQPFAVEAVELRPLALGEPGLAVGQPARRQAAVLQAAELRFEQARRQPLLVQPPGLDDPTGRASCRERVSKDGYDQGVARQKKKT